jgi:hypothetical protein
MEEILAERKALQVEAFRMNNLMERKLDSKVKAEAERLMLN